MVLNDGDLCPLFFHFLFQKRCRPIHCPVGQYRTNDGCKVLGYKWFADAISIYFVLTPRTKILAKEIEDILDRSPSEEILLKRNTFQSWKLRLLYKGEESGVLIKHFVAQVLYERRDMSIKPITLLHRIETSLHQSWRIELPGKSYDLTVSLDVNYGYPSYAHKENGSVEMLHVPTWLSYWADFVSNRQIARNQLLQKVIDDFDFFPNGFIVISKLFFCEQVELLPDEYITDGHNIYFLKQGKYLENGVYTQFGYKNPVYRVCLSEFIGQKSSSHGQEICLSFSTLCLFFYVLGRL